MEEPRVAQPVIPSVPKPSEDIQAEPSVTQPVPVDPNSPEERAELPNEPWQASPLFYEMANFLGVETREYEGTKDQISVITDWAIQQTNSNKIEDITHAIRQLEEKLQPPAWGEKRVAHLYRFLRLESRFDATRKALGAYTKTGRWD